jgi:hypothetical protein
MYPVLRGFQMEGVEGKEKQEILTEVITHINQIEGKLSLIEEKIGDINDLQIVNKLDIINLKNEIEKIRLASSTLSPEMIETLQHAEEVAKKLDRVKKIEKMYDEIKDLKSMGTREGLELMNQRISVLENIVKNINTSLPPSTNQLSSIKSRIKNLESRIAGLKPIKYAAPKAPSNHIEKRVTALEKRIAGLKPIKYAAPKTKDSIFYSQAKEIQEIKKRLEGLKPVKAERIKIKAQTINSKDIEKIKRDIMKQLLKELREMLVS